MADYRDDKNRIMKLNYFSDEEEDYEKRAVIQSQWNKSTKEFDNTTPRGSMASRRVNSYEDKKDSRGSQKTKSNSVSSSVTKLPKIHSNASTKYPREYNQARRRGSSRLSESEETSTSNPTSSTNESTSESEEDSDVSSRTESEHEKTSTSEAKPKHTKKLSQRSAEAAKKRAADAAKQKEQEQQRKEKERKEAKQKAVARIQERQRQEARLKAKKREEARLRKQKENEAGLKKQKAEAKAKEKQREEARRKVKQKENERTRPKENARLNENETEDTNANDPKATREKPRVSYADELDDRSSDSDEDNDYEEDVYDTRRIHSVKKDKRLRSSRHDAPRAFSGVLQTDDNRSSSGKSGGTTQRSEETVSDVGGTGEESELTSPDMEVDAGKGTSPEPEDEDSLTDKDAKLLFRAVKNLSRPEDVLIKTLIRRSPKQRMLTKERFEETYEMSLGTELKKVLGSAHFMLIDCLLGLKNKRDTADIHTALKARDIVKLVDIFTSRGSSSLDVSIASYGKENWDQDNLDLQYFLDYDVSLEQDLRDKISDEDCQHLLMALLGDRPESERVDEDMAPKDAEELREAGEGRFSNENGKFILLVKGRSADQLRATLNAYKQLSGGNDINELLEEDGCSQNFITAVNALDKSSVGSGQWAEQIHAQLKPNNAELISTMLERTDREMTAIRKSYRKRYQGELTDDIIGKCGREAGPLIAHVAARGGVTPAPGAKQPRPPQGEKPTKNRVNGIRVPSPPRKPTLRGFQPSTPEFGKDNPFQEVQKRPLGEHIRQTAKDKFDKKQPAKGNKTDRDSKKKTPSKKVGKSYNADEDVKKIKESMKGSGTDEDPLIQVLAGRTNEQRQAIRKKYQEKYRADLLDDLKSELSGDFEEAVVALMMGTSEYDAYCLQDALSGLGTSEAILIGILSTRNAKELKAICTQYEKMYDEPLVDALEEDTSAGLGELLGRLLQGERDQGTAVHQGLADQDADDLYQDGEEPLIVENETFKDVMTKRNLNHARAVFDKYNKLSGHSIEDTIKDSFEGGTADGYLGLAQVISSPSDFYAHHLHSAMTGIGTNDKMLIRILVSRSEVELADIRTRYKAMYQQTLEEAVENECSGDYQKLLLYLMKDKGVDNPKRKKDKKDDVMGGRVNAPVSKGSTKATPGKGKVGASPKVERKPGSMAKVEQQKTGASPKAERKAGAKKQTTPRKERPLGVPKPSQGSPYSTKNSPRNKAKPKAGKKIKEKQAEEKGAKEEVISNEIHEVSNEDEQEKELEEVVEGKEYGEEETPEERAKEREEEVEHEETKLVPRPPDPTMDTVEESQGTTAEDDAKRMEKALVGWNNHEDAIIKLLSTRTAKQRLTLRAKFEETHSKELLAVIRSELRGDFEEVVVQLLTPPEELLAASMHGALESISDDNCLLNALLAVSTHQEINTVSTTYAQVYKKPFLEDVRDTGAQAPYISVMEDILCGSRDPSYDVDEEIAKQDASNMYNDGEHSLKLRDDTFRDLLTKSNRSQVKAVCDEFHKLAGEDIVEGIKWAMIGECEDAILGLVKCLRDPAAYFAEHLQDCMEGYGTNDSKLISIIVSRSEIDLQNTKDRFHQLYAKDLSEAVRSECSGDCKTMLLALLSGGAAKATPEDLAQADAFAAILLGDTSMFLASGIQAKEGEVIVADGMSQENTTATHIENGAIESGHSSATPEDQDQADAIAAVLLDDTAMRPASDVEAEEGEVVVADETSQENTTATHIERNAIEGKHMMVSKTEYRYETDPEILKDSNEVSPLVEIELTEVQPDTKGSHQEVQSVKEGEEIDGSNDLGDKEENKHETNNDLNIEHGGTALAPKDNECTDSNEEAGSKSADNVDEETNNKLPEVIEIRATPAEPNEPEDDDTKYIDNFADQVPEVIDKKPGQQDIDQKPTIELADSKQEATMENENEDKEASRRNDGEQEECGPPGDGHDTGGLEDSEIQTTNIKDGNISDPTENVLTENNQDYDQATEVKGDLLELILQEEPGSQPADIGEGADKSSVNNGSDEFVKVDNSNRNFSEEDFDNSDNRNAATPKGEDVEDSTRTEMVHVADNANVVDDFRVKDDFIEKVSITDGLGIDNELNKTVITSSQNIRKDYTSDVASNMLTMFLIQDDQDKPGDVKTEEKSSLQNGQPQTSEIVAKKENVAAVDDAEERDWTLINQGEDTTIELGDNLNQTHNTEDGLLEKNLDERTYDTNKNGDPSSESKDEGIEVDTESKEDNSAEKNGNAEKVNEVINKQDVNDGEASESKGTNMEMKPSEQRDSGDGLKHVEHHGENDERSAASSRPHDPMCTKKQNEMQHQKPHRMDTTDNINPEMLKRLNMDEYRCKPLKEMEPGLESNADLIENYELATRNAKKEEQDNAGAKEAEGVEGTVAPVNSGINMDMGEHALGSHECTSTDEEVQADELFGDDWDSELVAIIERDPENIYDTVVSSNHHTIMEDIDEGAVSESRGVGLTIKAEIHSLKVSENASLGGDSGLGNSMENIKLRKPRTGEDSGMTPGVINSLVGTIIENSVNEYSSLNRQDVERVGNV